LPCLRNGQRYELSDENGDLITEAEGEAICGAQHRGCSRDTFTNGILGVLCPADQAEATVGANTEEPPQLMNLEG
jgi:hypothetical protein